MQQDVEKGHLSLIQINNLEKMKLTYFHSLWRNSSEEMWYACRKINGYFLQLYFWALFLLEKHRSKSDKKDANVAINRKTNKQISVNRSLI